MQRFLRRSILALSVTTALSAWAQEPVLNQTLKRAFAAGELVGLHSALAYKKDTRLAEVYFKGRDESWGRDLGVRQHSAEALHDLRSVTKSIVGLLYGIALAQGKVPALDQPLLAQFPQYADLKDGGAKERILVEHALSMRMGLQWREDLPYTDRRNSEIAMEYATDRYRYVLEQPVVHEPGSTWTYSGGATALVAKLISDGVGVPIDQFAQQHLFAPLGIKQFEWIAGGDGVPSAASGLRLTLPDLAKIGHMVANDGEYRGQSVVPSDWLKASFVSRSDLQDGVRYGYLWYVLGPEDQPVVFAAGNGGQRLTVNPQTDLIVASFSGLYNEPMAWRLPVKVITDYVVPQLQSTR